MTLIVLVFFQHCDKVVAPEMSDKAKGTFYGAMVLTGDEVALIKAETTTWKVDWTVERYE